MLDPTELTPAQIDTLVDAGIATARRRRALRRALGGVAAVAILSAAAVGAATLAGGPSPVIVPAIPASPIPTTETVRVSPSPTPTPTSTSTSGESIARGVGSTDAPDLVSTASTEPTR
ncbi:MAG: hypothetical protein QM713_11115 [Arachnia sp.]